MRKLRIFEHISLDGVIEMGEPGADTDFPYGDWSAPYRSAAGRERLVTMYGDSFDLLLGRRTYDAWSSSWPNAPSSPMADRLNAATKYVVTHRPESLAWGPFEGLSSDLVEDVGRIKASGDKDIILSGSSTLTSPLLEHGLVDELYLLVNPVLLGAGKLLLAQGTPARSFELVSTHTTSTGIVVHAYKFAGPLKNDQLKIRSSSMRFMIISIPKGYESAAPDALPNMEAAVKMMEYFESLGKAGVLIAADGLLPPSAGVRVSNTGGKPTVTDGPFAEAKEAVGGYWILQVRSREEAIEWAKRAPVADTDILEVRQMFEMPDEA